MATRSWLRLRKHQGVRSEKRTVKFEIVAIQIANDLANVIVVQALFSGASAISMQFGKIASGHVGKVLIADEIEVLVSMADQLSRITNLDVLLPKRRETFLEGIEE